MDREQVLAFRIASQRLDERRDLTLAEAAACPASDFQRDSALLALAARAEPVTRESYDAATDEGTLVVALSLRGAIHALDPADHPLWGRALVATDDKELGSQLGAGARKHLAEVEIAPTVALAEVAEAIQGALAGGRSLSKDELHEELRNRVRDELLPWCKGCESHHVAPMLWRFAGVSVGMRCDSDRRFLLDGSDGGGERDPADAVRRFLHFYGPATPKGFATWAGLATKHARRLWDEVEGELVEVEVDGERGWALAEDEAALESPPAASGVRLLPPRDPHLQAPDRELLFPDPELRKRVFRPVASPGVILQDGVAAGLWKVRARKRTAEFEVDELGNIDRDALDAEVERIAKLRGAEEAAIDWV